MVHQDESWDSKPLSMRSGLDVGLLMSFSSYFPKGRRHKSMANENLGQAKLLSVQRAGLRLVHFEIRSGEFF